MQVMQTCLWKEMIEQKYIYVGWKLENLIT
jgi:hypothetical protein